MDTRSRSFADGDVGTAVEARASVPHPKEASQARRTAWRRGKGLASTVARSSWAPLLAASYPTTVPGLCACGSEGGVAAGPGRTDAEDTTCGPEGRELGTGGGPGCKPPEPGGGTSDGRRGGDDGRPPVGGATPTLAEPSADPEWGTYGSGRLVGNGGGFVERATGGGTDVACASKKLAKSAAARASARERTLFPASSADSAARRSQRRASRWFPFDVSFAAVSSASVTPSESEARGPGKGWRLSNALSGRRSAMATLVKSCRSRGGAAAPCGFGSFLRLHGKPCFAPPCRSL